MPETLAQKAGTILVVNDEDLPLRLVVETLKTANFLVLQADSEATALKVAANYVGRIDLLVGNSQMPAVARLSFAEALRKTRPDISVMLTCGDILIGSSGCALIYNPFMPLKLLEMINAVLHPAEELQSVRRFRIGSSV
jgi:response regulator RpfG family c-di-GMP phosphodiesterase